jgi:hypothetical protein
MPVVGDSLHLLVSQISPVPLSTGLEFVHPLLSALLSESPPLYHLSIVKSHSIGFDKPFHLKSIASSIPTAQEAQSSPCFAPASTPKFPGALPKRFSVSSPSSCPPSPSSSSAQRLPSTMIRSYPSLKLALTHLSQPTCLPLFHWLVPCIWCGILITICLHSVACCPTMPHPGVIVSVDLIGWTGCR